MREKTVLMMSKEKILSPKKMEIYINQPTKHT
jgi:hypothetical protein